MNRLFAKFVRRDAGPFAGESGATLIEALITTALIGTGVVALLTSLQVAVSSAVVHQQLATAEATLRATAETIKAAPFVSCAGVGDFGSLPNVDGAQVTVVAVEHWDGTLGSSRPYAGGCADGSWPQLVTISVEMTDGPVAVSVQTEMVKRAEP